MPADQFLTHQTPSGIRALPWLPMAILAAYGLVLTWPALMPGFFVGSDGPTHVMWARHFVEQFWQGELYPRWLFEMNAGLGSPVFFQYGPVAYYITALVHPFVGVDPEGWHQVGITAAIAVIASGFTAYFWLSRLTNRSAGLIAAIFYMSEPYHVAFTLYGRFGFAELWAFVWLPLLMMWVQDITAGRKDGLLKLAFGYALLIMTHLPTALVFSPVLAAYGLTLSPAGLRLNRSARLAAAMSLGIGLSSIVLVPALMTQGYVWIDAMWSGVLAYQRNFPFYWLGITHNDGTPWLIGQVELSLAIACCLAWMVLRRQDSGKSWGEARFWIGVVFIAFLMMTPLSDPVWQVVTPLQHLQFPWRVATVVSLALATLTASVLSFRSSIHSASGLAFLLLLGTLVALLTVPAVVSAGLVAMTLGTTTADHVERTIGARVGQQLLLGVERMRGSVDVVEHLPHWVPMSLSANLLSGVQRMVKLALETPMAAATAGDGTVAVGRWSNGGVELTIDARTPVQVTIRQFYYPGWSARLRGDSEQELKCGPSSSYGLLQCDVPAGTHVVRVARSLIAQEVTGIAISAVSLALCLGIWIAGFLAAKKALNHPPASRLIGQLASRRRIN